MGDTQKSPTQDLRERTRFTRKMGCPTSESVGYFRATEIGVECRVGRLVLSLRAIAALNKREGSGPGVIEKLLGRVDKS